MAYLESLLKPTINQEIFPATKRRYEKFSGDIIDLINVVLTLVVRPRYLWDGLLCFICGKAKVRLHHLLVSYFSRFLQIVQQQMRSVRHITKIKTDALEEFDWVLLSYLKFFSVVVFKFSMTDTLQGWTLFFIQNWITGFLKRQLVKHLLNYL